MKIETSTVQRIKAAAFTLAETLIVIGIIGVVAALTLPNLNHATGDREKVTRVKKIYSSLTDAVDRAQAIYGDVDTWFNDLRNSYGDIPDMTTASERFAKRVIEFMKISKDCELNDGCFSSAPYLTPNGDINYNNYLQVLKGNKAYMVTLPDGVSLGFYVNNYGAAIAADIDGPNKGKNKLGDDIFEFSVYHNEKYIRHGSRVNQLNPFSLMERGNCTGDLDYYGCLTAWVIENENLDYLKATYASNIYNCPDGEPLNWDTKTSCK